MKVNSIESLELFSEMYRIWVPKSYILGTFLT